jgi:hypothetical protein
MPITVLHVGTELIGNLTGYTVGNIIGPQSFLNSEAPTYTNANTVMLVGYCICLALIVAYGVLCWHDNKKKAFQEANWQDSVQGQDVDVAEEWKDLTDKQVSPRRIGICPQADKIELTMPQNPKFRYTY